MYVCPIYDGQSCKDRGDRRNPSRPSFYNDSQTFTKKKNLILSSRQGSDLRTEVNPSHNSGKSIRYLGYDYLLTFITIVEGNCLLM